MHTTPAPALALALALAGSAAPAPARAQDAKAKLAGELARVLQPREAWVKMFDVATEQINQMGAMGGGLPPGFAANLRAELEKLLPYEEVVALHGTLLAKHYSEGEMHDLMKFYRSPLGAKTLRLQPEIAREAGAHVQQKMMSAMNGMMMRLMGGQGQGGGGFPGMGAPPAR